MSQPAPGASRALARQPVQTIGITDRIRGEFREMPGLRLTLSQARRLWSLDTATCSSALSILVDAGFLARKADGAFCRASDLAARPARLARA